jgi:hypothetical protein
MGVTNVEAIAAELRRELKASGFPDHISIEYSPRFEARPWSVFAYQPGAVGTDCILVSGETIEDAALAMSREIAAFRPRWTDVDVARTLGIDEAA